ncbi:IS200/IS605 family transposase [Brumimicrobium mesophilum]|uniref:IS200/IS605 family transposase n=1 Tax=Brumimicrobium mesophilum TaxID=392717 RepID=UPI000D14460B|nr:IS200/IS605 family transposase [Brumimicrobium mesophilum]
MPQSLPNHYIHIVFSTKNREPLIHPPFEKELHAYIAGICNSLECKVLIVGGYTDHIHILCMHSPKIAFMVLMQKIKANSSKWMKTKDESLRNFSWQRGYGSFSVNPSETDIVIKYIENQHEHHRKKSFQEEYRAFLKKYKVVYDENYVWD